jgi:hypothetical protein
MYPGSVLEYMSGVKKRKSCIPGVFWSTWVVRKRGSRVSRECFGVHEWCVKDVVMYPGSVLEYMSGV